MWNVIADHKEPLVRFLKRKAELLDLDKLSWADLDAPLAVTAESKVMDYQEGADFIIQQFSKFGSQLANFTKKLLKTAGLKLRTDQVRDQAVFAPAFH